MDFRQALTVISPDLMEILLPFVLVFTVIYAISAQVPHLKGNEKLRIVIALVVSLLVIIPHVTGQYYYGNVDVVDTINKSIPQVALIIIAVIMVLLLIGATGKADDLHLSWIRWVALAIVALIFMDNINYGGMISNVPFLNWFSDPDFQALVLIIVIFGLIVKFITSGPANEGLPVRDIFNEAYYGALSEGKTAHQARGEASKVVREAREKAAREKAKPE